ncbi:MAG: hypothetical protein KF893_03405 [Caldilineaceae bacterium]|nr:hypothetical protein [Caldilineaceae bacterium]
MLHHPGYRQKYAANLRRSLLRIPETVYDYKLGNRSALEWVIDRYGVSIDKGSGGEDRGGIGDWGLGSCTGSEIA